MFDNATALDRIEHAQSETPCCWCGAPTTAAAYDRSIWLECRSLDQPRSHLRRLLTFDFGHVQRPILEASDFDLAAW
jgi:hypothetical protein